MPGGHRVAAADAPVTILHAGTVLVTPGQAPENKKNIVIRNSRIEAVLDGFVAARSLAAGADFVDLSDKFVMPGMMDMHVHLPMNFTLPKYERKLNPADSLMGAIRGARYLLMSGFTTVRGPGDAEDVIFPLRDAIARGGVSPTAPTGSKWRAKREFSSFRPPMS